MISWMFRRNHHVEGIIYDHHVGVHRLLEHSTSLNIFTPPRGIYA